MKKTIVTVTGIRPDFIRMCEVFKKLDESFNHVLVHTGQHYDELLSDVFFKELKIREPDFNLNVGGQGREHFHQTGILSERLIELLRKKKINPEMILFLGDANTVSAAFSLKKEGYTIGHIEAGMRSGDKRMLEEINRTVCDHCSDYHFVYHEDYKSNLIKENLPPENIFVVGNTIIEPVLQIIKNIDLSLPKKHLLLDIHRPENFKYQERLKNILIYANECGEKYNLPVYMLDFKRTSQYIKEWNLDTKNIGVINLMSFGDYLRTLAQSLFLISDSGTAQEEPALLNVPAIVPRDYTERPQSVQHDCSYMIDVNSRPGLGNSSWEESHEWISRAKPDPSWLGAGQTSHMIVSYIKKILNEE